MPSTPRPTGAEGKGSTAPEYELYIITLLSWGGLGSWGCLRICYFVAVNGPGFLDVEPAVWV
jgi:hypothetical protein